MILALFLVSLLVSAVLAWKVYRAYWRVWDHTYGNWVVKDFFDRLYWCYAAIVLTGAFAINLVNDAVSERWLFVITCAFGALAIVGALLLALNEAEIEKRMGLQRPRDTGPVEKDMFLHDPRR